MLCLIDNYDSFTYNVATYFHQLGSPPKVIKNDEISVDELKGMPISAIILSPGPGTPEQSGISLQVIRDFWGVPILGVCLGHQAIGQAFGANIVNAKKVMHGKVSLVHHDGRGVFEGVTNPVKVARYHSLVISPSSIPEELVITAWTEGEDGEVEEVMGIRHKELEIEGVQFHPESVLTEYGHLVLANFIRKLNKLKA